MTVSAAILRFEIIHFVIAPFTHPVLIHITIIETRQALSISTIIAGFARGVTSLAVVGIWVRIEARLAYAFIVTCQISMVETHTTVVDLVSSAMFTSVMTGPAFKRSLKLNIACHSLALALPWRYYFGYCAFTCKAAILISVGACYAINVARATFVELSVLKKVRWAA